MLRNRFPLCPAPEQESVQQQEDHRANYGHDPASDIVFPHEQTANPSADERTGDAEKNVNDASAGVFARHQQFSDCANNETEHQNTDDPMTKKKVAHIGRVCPEMNGASTSHHEWGGDGTARNLTIQLQMGSLGREKCFHSDEVAAHSCRLQYRN
jgi:hypothetical protein